MKKDLFRKILDSKDIKKHIIGQHKNLYFDYTASGLAFEPIEARINEVLQTYANTHSKEASMANTTNNYFEEARENLKRMFELDGEFTILPNGCGATAAIKHFQEIMGIYIPPATKQRFNIQVDKSKLPLVLVGPYEHHSNDVSFREALCEKIRINLDKNGLVDLNHLEELLKKNKHREIIGSFCIASNVTGIISDYKNISKLLRKYNAIVCFDAAASSPYMNVPCEYYDAMFVSPHKLLGGPGSCGLLLIRKSLVDSNISPTFAGGGTVLYVNKDTQEYDKKIENRENAGTPGILQFIRASLAYQLRNEIGFEYIKQKKEKLTKYFIKQLKRVPNITVYGNLEASNIGIVSFNIKDLSPYDLCARLSNIFGVQTRAGCSCAGPYGHDLLGIEKIDLANKPGWVRVSIHYTMEKEDIDNLLTAIKDSIK
ncbi:aminotransferase [Malaciobacter molluscorum LMG 25693]|uniref:Aminotransferase n=1 Tax=Malaciobacter molluscorum LMG 25693 TaxID=870501 RepID=A0A2G1DHE3_9BACT|nr:aminotransferase class V-fold PLP-dependent enzyme [Malaciobacter molluscorum]AXX93685.1 cysteine sulfinate desulfinase [Malaciobacter molluscorum LMG 25693]PHO17905.1 aminotransferase [Malaciobacter molluscorum LMG 25693]